MKKKNSIVQLAKLKNKFYLKDKKIKKIYKIFKNILFKHIKKESFCIGVSGGPDSLALAYLSKIYSKEFRTKYRVLIVNHRLRKESTKEAKEVKSILLKQGILSKILTWKGKIPKSNIQLKARQIRYSLLLKECYSLKIKNLILGHQINDFIENFLIRLFRGSGLKGLTSFNQVFSLNKNNQKIIRPLITIKKKDLIYVSKKIFGKYIVDPTNFKEKYLRTRIRNYINNFKSDGLDIDKIKLTINNLQIAENSLDHYFKKSIQEYVRQVSQNKWLISNNLFDQESKEIVFRVIGHVISKAGNTYYPPRGKSLQNLIDKMNITKPLKVTLGKCIIERVKNSFIVSNEFKA
jgi:tRNA(Ile)-lysidine synthase